MPTVHFVSVAMRNARCVVQGGGYESGRMAKKEYGKKVGGE
jgi:hypothetical protein